MLPEKPSRLHMQWGLGPTNLAKEIIGQQSMYLFIYLFTLITVPLAQVLIKRELLLLPLLLMHHLQPQESPLPQPQMIPFDFPCSLDHLLSAPLCLPLLHLQSLPTTWVPAIPSFIASQTPTIHISWFTVLVKRELLLLLLLLAHYPQSHESPLPLP